MSLVDLPHSPRELDNIKKCLEDITSLLNHYQKFPDKDIYKIAKDKLFTVHTNM